MSSTSADPVGVEIVFRVLREGKPLFPKIKVLDQEGAIAFNAMDTHERWLQPTAPGEYVSTAWIPGNLLNEGSVIVEAAICSIDFPKLEHHAAVYEAISFEVLDPGEGDSARGAFAASGAACPSSPAARLDRRAGDNSAAGAAGALLALRGRDHVRLMAMTGNRPNVSAHLHPSASRPGSSSGSFCVSASPGSPASQS